MSLFPRLSIALAALFIAGSSAALSAAPKTPNVIVILADELGYGDVGFNGGSSIPTPNLNRIAAGGVVLTQAYVASQNSSASRAGLLTGRYPNRFGYERSVAWRPQDPTVGLPAEEKTLAEVLRPLGFQSGLIGKWHLGAHENFHPINRGFDHFFGYLGGAHKSFPEEFDAQHTYDARNELDSHHTWLLRGMQPVRTERHLTDDLSLEALEFVRSQGTNPFFLFLSYNAPRSPLQVPDAALAAYGHIKDEKRRKYAAMIGMMDRGVGQLLDLLDAQEMTDDTLLFFTSSLGGDIQATGAYNGPVRGTRGEPWEGGIRVPFVVRWPRVLPGGVTYKKPVSLLDIFATVAAATRAPADPARPLDGVDLAPFLRGENRGEPHARLFLRSQDAGLHVVREGDFKLVKTKTDPESRLFNLARDPMERQNIAQANPEVVRSLQESYRAWNAQMIEAVIPGIGPNEWTRGRR
jgi:arylsulfatase A-like enzyme